MSPLHPKLTEIAKLLDSPHPRLVVVVGAGISLGATGLPHASWTGLLKHGINYLVQGQIQKQWGIRLEQSLEESFSPFNLKKTLQHAELVEQALNTPDPTAFAEWLTSGFSSFKAKENRQDTLDALRDLQEAGALILTTNYDSLLSDITHSPPVTWEEHHDFLRVMTRQKPGILHVHGHWQRPSSIVLGRSSYDRVVADDDFQQLFSSLWLEYSWLYVGCGDGLDDPNLGRLLEWGKRWGESAMPDYFLAREDKAEEIESRAEKPKNLASIGYSSYDDLPHILRSLPPFARSWPFVRVDEEFPLFRSPFSSIPFPTRQEYLDGQVPALNADAAVAERLRTHGWACVIDLASVGKTTLALRLATAAEQRDHPVFYFDLKTEIDDAEGRPSAALRRLARPGALLILDNVHHQPELARQLWHQWKADPRDSRLLIVATRSQRPVITTPEQDLIFFEKHLTNPAILLALEPDDLGRIAAHIYRRNTGSAMPRPSREVLIEWHRDYRAALNAFTFAVMRGLADLQKGSWQLPTAYASEWVRDAWLKNLDESELQNAVCLAAFGAQEFEMYVPDTALPHPGQTTKMHGLGLVVRTDVGRFGQYRRFSLREPGWGRLILTAQEGPADVESILFAGAARHPMIALVLDRRLKAEALVPTRDRLWEYLDANQEVLASNLFLADVALSFVGNLLRQAQAAHHGSLALNLWQTIESQPNEVARRAWETSLHIVGSFLEIAYRQGRDTAPLWDAIESDPEKLAANAWQSSLAGLGSFFEVAKRHGRNTAPLWKTIEREPDKLAALIWETPLNDVGSFLEVAQRQRRDTGPMWAAIEREPDKLAASALQTSLDKVGSFLEVAQRHRRDTDLLWGAIESEPDKLLACAWQTSFDKLGSFLEVAQRQERDTTPLWEAIEREPDKLAASAWQTSLDGLGSFLEVAQRQGRDTTPLWEAIESEPEKLAALVWETSLKPVASFLEVAQRQGRDTAPLWDAIESKPDELAARAWATSLEHVTHFMEVAYSHKRDTRQFWLAITGAPDKPEERFRLENLAARAWETTLDGVGAFLDIAKQQDCDSSRVWQELLSQPAKLAESAWATPLGKLGSFINISNQHGQSIESLYEMLANEPDRLSQKGKNAPLDGLVSLAHHAPAALLEIALREIKPGHWNATRPGQSMLGGTWLAWNCVGVERTDLAADLLLLLLRRANRRDFPPKGGGFGQACWLLANIPPNALKLVEPFLNAVCTNQWLESAYKEAACGSLARGLRHVALHQTAERCRRFRHLGLAGRLYKELARFETAEAKAQSEIIQLLGSTELSGAWAISSQALTIVRPETISELAVSLLPNSPEVTWLDDRQIQFWLGLRAFVSISKMKIPIPRDVVEKTLELWRENLVNSLLEPNSTSHRVNQSMIEWLENCLSANPVALLPSKQPLWTLVGLPVPLDLPPRIAK